MEEQENRSQELDFLLHIAATFALESTQDTLKTNSAGLGEMLENLAGIRAVVFHDVQGQEINI